MKAPDKIYVEVCEDGIFAFEKPPFEESIEYVRKDIVDETVEVAEDHAYFAGKEKLREAILEWAKNQYGHFSEREQEEASAYGASPDAIFISGKCGAFKSLIDKINSL